jgi:hypothetical protein
MYISVVVKPNDGTLAAGTCYFRLYIYLWIYICIYVYIYDLKIYLWRYTFMDIYMVIYVYFSTCYDYFFLYIYMYIYTPSYTYYTYIWHLYMDICMFIYIQIYLSNCEAYLRIISSRYVRTCVLTHINIPLKYIFLWVHLTYISMNSYIYGYIRIIQ